MIDFEVMPINAAPANAARAAAPVAPTEVLLELESLRGELAAARDKSIAADAELIARLEQIAGQEKTILNLTADNVRLYHGCHAQREEDNRLIDSLRDAIFHLSLLLGDAHKYRVERLDQDTEDEGETDHLLDATARGRAAKLARNPAGAVHRMSRPQQHLNEALDDLAKIVSFAFALHQRVLKCGGSYQLAGEIVARFRTYDDQPRYVVNHKPVAPGLLHIYAEHQLIADDN